MEEAISSQKIVSTSTKQSQKNVYKVLDFCVERYRRFNQDESEIDRETDGHLKTMEIMEANQRKNGRERLIQWVNIDVHQLENMENEEYHG